MRRRDWARGLGWVFLVQHGGVPPARSSCGISSHRAVAVLLLSRAYQGFLLPLLGFLFLPLTTLTYAWMVNSGVPTTGLNLLILIIAVVIDLSSVGGGEYHRRTRWVKA